MMRSNGTMMLSRRSALLGGVCAAAAIGTRRVFGQPAASDRVPRDEAHWARMGVSLEGATALVTGSTDGLGKELAR